MIYFIESQGLVKIGFSMEPSLRVSKVQSDSPYPCKLIGAMPGSREDEMMVQQRFQRLRYRGEWFRLDHELRSFIDQHPVIRDVRAKDKPEPTDPISRWMWLNNSTDRHLGSLMGVSQTQVNRVRRGKSDPSCDFLRALFEKTGVTPNEVLGIGAPEAERDAA
jgi:transcriptional regulator with XRE-family HTH domain